MSLHTKKRSKVEQNKEEEAEKKEEDKKASGNIMYLLKQVFRTSGDSHTIYVDLGIYSSEQALRRAADLFHRAHPEHPDTPYSLLAWPCEVDSDAHNIEDETNPIIREKAFHVYF